MARAELPRPSTAGWAGALALWAAACGGHPASVGPRRTVLATQADAGSAPARPAAPGRRFLSWSSTTLDTAKPRVVAFEHGDARTLLFSATLDLSGTPSGTTATLALAELDGLPEGTDAEAILARRGRVLLERFVGGGSRTRVRALVRPAEGVPALGLALGLHAADGSSVTATARHVSLVEARGVDGLDASPFALDVDAPRGQPVRGHLTLGGVSRPALALVNPGEVSVPLKLEPGAEAQLELGLFPLPEVVPGAEVEIEVRVEAEQGPSVEWTWRGRAAERRGARWRSHALADLPAGAGRVVLTPRGAAAAGVIPLVAGTVAYPTAKAPDDLPLSVVLVSIDTLRADQVGFLGGPPGRTPHLDALALRSWVFERTWTQCSYTLPAHVSLFSGQFPSVHGVHDPAQRVSRERTQLLAEILAQRGYATAAFTGGGFVDPRFGFARGFEVYGTLDPVANLESPRVQAWLEASEELDLEGAAELQVDGVLDWVRGTAGSPFFLFLHTYAAHEFDPPARHLEALGFAPPDAATDEAARSLLSSGQVLGNGPQDRVHLARLEELYAGGVRQADAGVGRLVEGLEGLGLLNRTLIVVTSDHGKELGDHGYVGHGHTLYEELLRIPLLVFDPRRGSGRSDRPAMLVDVLPTVLAGLDLPLPRGVGGHDLFGPEEAGRARFAELAALSTQRALARGNLKTIHRPPGRGGILPPGPEEQSFDLRLDPGEQRPLAPDPDRLEFLLRFHRDLVDQGRALGRAPDLGTLDQGLVGRLRALGYAVGEEDR